MEVGRVEPPSEKHTPKNCLQAYPTNREFFIRHKSQFLPDIGIAKLIKIYHRDHARMSTSRRDADPPLYGKNRNHLYATAYTGAGLKMFLNKFALIGVRKLIGEIPNMLPPDF